MAQAQARPRAAPGNAWTAKVVGPRKWTAKGAARMEGARPRGEGARRAEGAAGPITRRAGD
jgi:hypothetical protein